MKDNFKIEKVCISLGLGGKPKNEIERIKDHITELLKNIKLYRFNFITTKAKKSIAKWVKKNEDIGLKTTLRKTNKDLLVNMLTQKDLHTQAKFVGRTLYIGIRDHRTLRLETYNFTAPEYGLVFQIVFAPIISRPYEKKGPRSSKKKIKLNVSKEEIIEHLNKYKTLEVKN